ncbi:MAG TPA: LytTR family DNA-binding domain-containing protein [Opitutus sp.]|nr:LytTR family DNA-binding domain-containing protein [Opitutus sp.]
MNKLRVLIVDDEPLARDRLRTLLAGHPPVEILGECANGPEAIASISELRPDLVFLDVQMPGCSGLEVVQRIPAAERPAIIFVTAHERFAVDAFAAQAVDYLLKPFGPDRLQLALERAANLLATRRANDLGTRLENIIAERTRDTQRLAVRSEGRIVLLKVADIVWAEAANNYCILHLNDAKRLMLRETLSALEVRIGATHFARVNRSALVHIEQIRELQPSTYGDYVVVLRNGERLPLSRNLRGRLERFIPGAL